MAISAEKLQQIIATQAGGLCSARADKKLNEYATAMNDSAIPRDGQYHDVPKPDYNYEDGWGDGGDSPSYEPSIPTMAVSKNKNIQAYTNDQVKASGLPDAIKESLIKNKITVKQQNVTDSLGFDTEKIKRQRQLMEERNPGQNIVTSTPTTLSVDYSLIKTIVSECVRDYFDNMEDTSLKTIKLSGGTIKIVDNSGNIYVAKLEKKGNVNDKK
jgi:hypothetical protein